MLDVIKEKDWKKVKMLVKKITGKEVEIEFN
jgi:hypothetical protein